MPYKCEWKTGDVFAYRLESHLAKEMNIFGRYLLIQKVDEAEWYPKHIIPIVYVKLSKHNKIPTMIEEYNELEFIQTGFTKYEERFWPIDGSRIKNDIAEKSETKYEVDDYGFLPQFRIEIVTRSKKELPPNLNYICNFINAKKPEKEFIPHSKTNIMSVSWKKFENRLITLYCGHNLKGLEIYKK